MGEFVIDLERTSLIDFTTQLLQKYEYMWSSVKPILELNLDGSSSSEGVYVDTYYQKRDEFIDENVGAFGKSCKATNDLAQLLIEMDGLMIGLLNYPDEIGLAISGISYAHNSYMRRGTNNRLYCDMTYQETIKGLLDDILTKLLEQTKYVNAAARDALAACNVYSSVDAYDQKRREIIQQNNDLYSCLTSYFQNCIEFNDYYEGKMNEIYEDLNGDLSVAYKEREHTLRTYDTVPWDLIEDIAVKDSSEWNDAEAELMADVIGRLTEEEKEEEINKIYDWSCVKI